LRIALITETFLPRYDGIVRMLVEFLTYLKANGHSAVVFAPGAGPTDFEGTRVVRVPGMPFPPYPGLVLAPYSRRMKPLLRAWRPDVVHLAGPFVLGAYAARVARSLGIPAAAHFQTDLARFAAHYGLGLFEDLTWRRLVSIHNTCAINFAPTESVATELRDRGMRNVHVAGRGVDTALFHPKRRDHSLRARLTGGWKRPVLTYVGRLAPEKSLDTLVAVAQALPYCALLIVGDGPSRAELAEKLAGYDVYFTGWLYGEQLAAAYATADIFVFPSATETFGQVVREAMASGLPTVGVRAGGVQDLIEPEVTGLLAAPDDRSSFVAATRRLVEHEALRRAMGQAARLQAETHTWEAVFDNLMELYAGLTGPPVEAHARKRLAPIRRILL
jgi:glycosyltransferase involved in cell wall biosynthesis